MRIYPRIHTCGAICAFVGIFSMTSADEKRAAVPMLRGVCYGPYRINQSPETGVMPTKAEIIEDLGFLARSGISRRIRTYSCTGTLAGIPAMCKDLGIECWPGAWLDGDRGSSEREIRGLIEVANMRLPNCPVLVVGNEVLLRQEIEESRLIETIMRVKRETGLPVAYAEIGALWEQHPRVAEAVDVILVHLYPFWEECDIGGAMGRLVESMQRLRKLYPDKRIVIGETGWPSNGERNGQAVPSEENQARYLKQFIEASGTHNMDYFYFSLYNEPWKAHEEGQRGALWGIFSAEGILNPQCSEIMAPVARSGMKRQAGAVPLPAKLDLPAFVYREGDSDENRFRPSNFMGDTKALAVDAYCNENPRSGNHCLKVRYSAQGPAGWAGIFFVGPYRNHWGDLPGYMIEGARKIVFWARGEKGAKVEFKIGGMDTPGKPFRDSLGLQPRLRVGTELKSEWTEYSIPLDGADTSSLIGGFCLVVNVPGNPNGCTFYLDDIVIVADHVPPPLPGGDHTPFR